MEEWLFEAPLLCNFFGGMAHEFYTVGTLVEACLVGGASNCACFLPVRLLVFAGIRFGTAEGVCQLNGS